MNVLEVIGYITLTIIALGALLWSVGMLHLDIEFTVEKSKRKW